MKLGGKNLPSETCRQVGSVLEQIGNKWAILIMVILSQRPRYFNELRREIAVITQKVLTSTLRGLERDGYVSRTILDGNVVQVEYALTRLGHEVLEPMNGLATWALKRREQIEDARRRYDMAIG
ncbi:MAG: helix-turn-helix transcriptional regulator [Variovorax sp.]|nr:helix-turn-helix transcriptional regulator [Variovorax sp.]